LRRAWIVVTGVAFAWLVVVAWLRPHAEGPPLFTVEHAVEIHAPADTVWSVLTETAAYPDWNPYVLAIDGELVEGQRVDVTILQEDWRGPLTVSPRIVRMEAGSMLHWHGSAVTTGLHETDHYFSVEPIGPRRTRLVQREEFRGWLAGRLDPAGREYTQRAFAAMNLALADRAAAVHAQR
jgi:hypothetical protein